MKSLGEIIKDMIFNNGELKNISEKELINLINKENIKIQDNPDLKECILELEKIKPQYFENKKNAIMADIYASKYEDDNIYDIEYLQANSLSWGVLIASNFNSEINDFMNEINGNRVPKDSREDMYENIIAELTGNKYEKYQKNTINQNYFIVIDQINQILGKKTIDYDNKFKQFLKNTSKLKLKIKDINKIDDKFIDQLVNFNENKLKNMLNSERNIPEDKIKINKQKKEPNLYFLREKILCSNEYKSMEQDINNSLNKSLSNEKILYNMLDKYELKYGKSHDKTLGRVLKIKGYKKNIVYSAITKSEIMHYDFSKSLAFFIVDERIYQTKDKNQCVIEFKDWYHNKNSNQSNVWKEQMSKESYNSVVKNLINKKVK